MRKWDQGTFVLGFAQGLFCAVAAAGVSIIVTDYIPSLSQRVASGIKLMGLGFQLGVGVMRM